MIIPSQVARHDPPFIGSSGAGNRLLSMLPADEDTRITAAVHPITMKPRQIFHKQGEPIRFVYFPGGGAYSLTRKMRNGRLAEIATVGNEGVIGGHAFFGDGTSTTQALMKVPDTQARVMSIEAFAYEMHQRGAFYNRVIRYSQALAAEIMQTTACNTLHSAEQRVVRSLLMTHDRVGDHEFELTHEFLAAMLGLRRATVTAIIGKLQKDGQVCHRRGFITIADAPALENATCECYHTVKKQFARLLPEFV
jgi:CRP-like cAMP-binding protein